MFIGGEFSGLAAAIFFSLLQTCLLNHVNPATYLEDVLNLIMAHPIAQLRDLLHHCWQTRPQAV